MTFLLFCWTAYVMAGVLVMLAVRCWGIWDPTHIHIESGYGECLPGPAERCPSHWVGRKPLPLVGWVFGVAIWPLVLALWIVILVLCALDRVLNRLWSIRI